MTQIICTYLTLQSTYYIQTDRPTFTQDPPQYGPMSACINVSDPDINCVGTKLCSLPLTDVKTGLISTRTCCEIIRGLAVMFMCKNRTDYSFKCYLCCGNSNMKYLLMWVPCVMEWFRGEKVDQTSHIRMQASLVVAASIWNKRNEERRHNKDRDVSVRAQKYIVLASTSQCTPVQ